MPDVKNLLEGKFAKVGYSLVEGAVVTFLGEGKLEKSSFDDDDNADERLTIPVEINGEKKLITPNMTSMRDLSEGWGTDTKGWVGKKATVSLEKKRVFGQSKQVAFYHPVETLGIKSEGEKQSVDRIIEAMEQCPNLAELEKVVGEMSKEISALNEADTKIFLHEKHNVELKFNA